MLVIVLIANLLYAWYSRRVTTLPVTMGENWLTELDYKSTFERVTGCTNEHSSRACSVIADQTYDFIDIQSLVR
jgi:hypothetical protein